MPAVPDAQRKSAVRVWWLAARPKTLPAGIVPVLVGSVIAYDHGGFHLPAFLAALFGSIMIQIGTNFANDLFDYLKQTDTNDRIGPLRVTQAGLATPRQMALATMIVFSLAVLAGVYLVYRGGWPVVIIGVSSILFGILYTAGPLALGYIGIADLFVLVFFGPVALAGTYYVQALYITPAVIMAGIPLGMLSTAILDVNNLRDMETDRKGGKRTLAVRYGRTFARYEYLLLLLAAALIPVLMVTLEVAKPPIMLAVFYLPFSYRSVSTVFSSVEGDRLNKTLAATGRLLIIYGLLFSIGWLW
jgi:1,4-dihydroxy-2-naphthoate octaprenyltransferase